MLRLIKGAIAVFSISVLILIQVTPATAQGTEEDPYIITTGAELQAMNNDKSAWYELGNDLDLSPAGENYKQTGEGFLPIGDNTNKFTGHFDGKEYKIKGLFIDRPSTTYIGLFGYADSGAEVKNVGLVDADVTGGSYAVGGLVAANMGGTISNCYATGNVSGNGTWHIGGLVGKNGGGTISNSHATVSISGGDHNIGGLSGSNNNGTISNSYASGSVAGNADLGGLVGWGGSGTISKSYSTGNVSGHSVGGLVGRITSGTVSNSYATGSVTGVPNWVTAGLVGYNDTGSITNSYATGYVSNGGTGEGGLVGTNINGACPNSFWDTETSKQAISACGTGKTTTEMKTESTFTNAGWDFYPEGTEDIWDMNGGDTYPYHHWRFPPIVAQLVVSSSSVTLYPGDTAQFTAAAYEASGDPIPDATFSWSLVVGGGTITNAGLFTAGSTPGTYVNTVRATVSGISDYATVIIQPRELPKTGPNQTMLALLGLTLIPILSFNLWYLLSSRKKRI